MEKGVWFITDNLPVPAPFKTTIDIQISYFLVLSVQFDDTLFKINQFSEHTVK